MAGTAKVRRNPRFQITLKEHHQALAMLERAMDMFPNRFEAKRALIYVLAGDFYLRKELLAELLQESKALATRN